MAKTPTATVSLDQARAFWHARQGLRNPFDQGPAEIVAATGWPRSLGGSDAYLALFARAATLDRATVDTAVAAGELRIVPAVRNCMYLLPAKEVPLLMALAADLARPRIERDLEKVEVAWDEVETLAAEVEKALAAGPLETHAIRKALPDGAVRSLGDPGKKIGMSSPLPVALRELEFRGTLERRPVGDRLDTEKYAWRLASPTTVEVPADPTARLAAVIERFLTLFGPATVKELSTWIGVSQRDAKAALAKLPVVSVAIEEHTRVAVLLERDLDALTEAQPPASTFSFLPFEDNLLTVHGGPGVLANPRHHDREVKVWGRGKGSTLGDVRHLHQRPLLLGENLAGFWEFDPDAKEVITLPFDPLPAKSKKALAAEAERLGAFIRDEIGHARSFSLDTDDKLRERAAALRDETTG